MAYNLLKQGFSKENNEPYPLLNINHGGLILPDLSKQLIITPFTFLNKFITKRDSKKLIGFISVSLFYILGLSATLLNAAENPDLIAFEAENYYGQTKQDEHYWQTSSDTQASNGSLLTAGPNIGANKDTNYYSTSPRLDYPLIFKQNGTYYVWVRGIGKSRGDDSVHVGIDNKTFAPAENISNFSKKINWSNTTSDGNRAVVYIDSPGVHTINIWMREDGFILDKIVLAKDTAYRPSGLGPETQFAASSSKKSINVTSLNSLNLTWQSPASYTDGTPMSDLAGYIVYASSSSGSYTKNDILKNVPSLSNTGGKQESLTIDKLDPGSYYFAITTYNYAGQESQLSDELSVNVSYP